MCAETRKINRVKNSVSNKTNGEMVLITIVFLALITRGATGAAEIRDHHNLGYILQPRGEITVVAETANLAFVTSLPKITNVTEVPLFECEHIVTRGQDGAAKDAPTMNACQHLITVVQTFQ